MKPTPCLSKDDVIYYKTNFAELSGCQLSNSEIFICIQFGNIYVCTSVEGKHYSILLFFFSLGKFCFKGQCYVYNTQKMTSMAAQNYCRDLGYDLVKISSEKEQNVLKEFIHASIPDSSYPDHVWLGK